jgi:AraC-like DNA-binding protein
MSLDYQEINAPPALDHLISCVWFLTGQAAHYHPQPVVPDGRLELLVHRADPFWRLTPGGSAQVQDTILVAGQLTHPIHLLPGSDIDVVGVRLNPVGAQALLGISLLELTNAVVSLRTIRPRLAVALEAAAAVAGSKTEQAFALMRTLDRALSRMPDGRMIAVVRRLAAGSLMSLDAMVSAHGMSPKTLERRFRNEVGLTPKMFQRVVRFRMAFRMLEHQRGGGARIAAAAGYYDQAHMIRDFRQFTGTSPREFFRPETPLAGLLLSGLAADPPHWEIDPSSAATLRPLDAGDQ